MANQYEFEINDGAVVCYYASPTGITFSALAVISEYADLDAAKSAAMSLAVQNEKTYNEMMVKTDE